ncbi:unnamed protein product [Cuscuta epithymum]|uniref:Uncharacterized protein n=1 Tax=Cuscuta epithymum TaxID=186058 RepID=A0AAV0FCP9_9ASTE|nr:unnamed protein product [Cuscuta epithymum]
MIADWYSKKRYLAAYHFHMQPILGKMFMQCDQYEAIEPPNIVKMASRPRHKRIKASNERNPNPTKLSRKKIIQTCSLCTLLGHNRTTCPNGSNQVPPQGKTPRTRPTSSTNPESATPCLESETIIAKCASQMGINPNAQTKMVIPCERTLRKKLPFKRACEITRNIRFCGDG